jgi:hypothetical protein
MAFQKRKHADPIVDIRPRPLGRIDDGRGSSGGEERARHPLRRARLGIALEPGNPLALPPTVWYELEAHAAYHGIGGAELAYRLLLMVLRQHLVDAVLDDR